LYGGSGRECNLDIFEVGVPVDPVVTWEAMRALVLATSHCAFHGASAGDSGYSPDLPPDMDR
jgi:hypothetical protein